MKGIHFVSNEKGKKVAVQIDLKMYGDLWEDFYDHLAFRSRKLEPKESLKSVKQRLIKQGKVRV